MDPIFIFSHIQLAVARYKNGQVEQAMAQFRRLSEKFPLSPEVSNYHGELLLDQQKYEEAVAKFEQSIELDRASSVASLSLITRTDSLAVSRETSCR